MSLNLDTFSIDKVADATQALEAAQKVSTPAPVAVDNTTVPVTKETPSVPSQNAQSSEVVGDAGDIAPEIPGLEVSAPTFTPSDGLETPQTDSSDASDDTTTTADSTTPATDDGAGVGESDRPTLRLFDGENELEIPESALIEVKIDGKVEKIPLAEYRNRVSGEVALQRRYSQFDNEKKAFQTVQKQWGEEQAEMRLNMELLSRLSPEQMIDHIARVKGVDRSQFYGQFVKKVVDQINMIAKMTPTERELYEKNRLYENEREISTALQQLKQQQDVQTQEQQHKQQYQTKVFQALSEADVTQDDFKAALQKVDHALRTGQLQWDKDVDGPITDFDIIEFARHFKVQGIVNEQISLKLPKASVDIQKQIQAAVAQFEGDSYRSESEIRNFVVQFIDNKFKSVKENLSKKATPVATSKKTSSESTQNRSIEEQKQALQSLLPRFN